MTTDELWATLKKHVGRFTSASAIVRMADDGLITREDAALAIAVALLEKLNEKGAKGKS